MILLDTHTLIWWLTSPQLVSKNALEVLDKSSADHPVYVSAISIWEIGMLVKKGRLELTLPVEVWLAKVIALEQIEVIDIDWRIARTANLIDYPYPDLADRLIIATALEYSMQLVSKDQRIIRYKKVNTLW